MWWDKLANLHLNAFEVHFEEPNQKFEFCKKGLTFYHFLRTYDKQLFLQ